MNRRAQVAEIEDASSRVLYDRGLAFGRIRFSMSTYRGRERLDIRDYWALLARLDGNDKARAYRRDRGR